ncbi:hypothetical protein NL676_027033 [Syzygium grande]|nr:hypothetical protein NL676_027033 [Syzygium grande]
MKGMALFASRRTTEGWLNHRPPDLSMDEPNGDNDERVDGHRLEARGQSGATRLRNFVARLADTRQMAMAPSPGRTRPDGSSHHASVITEVSAS